VSGSSSDSSMKTAACRRCPELGFWLSAKFADVRVRR
jgi:hypothetical protein